MRVLFFVVRIGLNSALIAENKQSPHFPQVEKQVKTFNKFILKIVSAAIACSVCIFSSIVSAGAQDLQADNMLVYQRSYGGWPKHINEVKLDYTRPLAEKQKRAVIADSLRKDATVDNGATVKEIRYLAKAYKQYKNVAYLIAANKGIRYLLKAQYPVGGWPQYYPDSSLYRGQITYNDNAMVNVLNLLLDVTKGANDMDVVDSSYLPAITMAIDRGINCILATQIKVKGKLTAWCTQYDQKTLKPAQARKFELPSISANESAGIVDFLMRIEKPSDQIKQAITAAVGWFDEVKIRGYKYVDIKDPSQPKGIDRVIQPDPSSTIWARFYEIETNEPLFAGRDSEKKKKLSEIEVERRTGYAWYGTWPSKVLNKKYPDWLKKNKA
jgi:PelA/Pel-15E family pectate lyase